MTFELMEKGFATGLRTIPQDSISIRGKRILFGDKFINYFGESCFIEVHLDTENNLIGFKKAEENENSYKMLKGILKASILANRTSKGLYVAKIDKENEMVILKVPEISNVEPYRKAKNLFKEEILHKKVVKKYGEPHSLKHNKSKVDKK